MAWYFQRLTSVERYAASLEAIDPSPDFRAESFRQSPLGEGQRLTDTSQPPLRSVPKAARCATTRKTLPDLSCMEGDWIVSERFKDIVEDLDFHVHQFFPIDIYDKKDRKFAGDFYLINICTLINSIVPEKSTIKSIILPDTGRVVWLSERPPGAYMTLRKVDLGDKNIWREEMFVDYGFISDRLKDEIIKAKITGINLERLCPAFEI